MEQELLEGISEAQASINAAQESLATAVETLLPDAIDRLNETVANELRAIRQLLKQAIDYAKPVEPGYVLPFNLYVDFDWSSIDAKVISHDQHGATIVAWGGYYWKRRSKKDSKYGRAIWFNRTHTPLNDTDWTYVRLVTFRDQHPPQPIEFDMPRRKVNTVPKAIEPTAVSPASGSITDFRAQALAAERALDFDTAVSMLYPELDGSIDSAATMRQGVSFTPHYSPVLNKAYLAGMDKYATEFKYQLARGKSRVEAHNAAKVKAHRVFNRKQEEKSNDN